MNPNELTLRFSHDSLLAIRRSVMGMTVVAALAATGCIARGESESAPAIDAPELAPQAVTTCVTIQRGTFGNVEDTQINTNSPDTNYGSEQTFSTGGPRLAFLRFDVSSIPSSATIVSAVATLKPLTAPVNQGVIYFLYPGPWAESTLTANNFGDVGFFESFATVTSGGASLTFDLTSDVDQWVHGTAFNDGVNIGNYTNIFKSSEWTVAADRPKLRVCYQ